MKGDRTMKKDVAYLRVSTDAQTEKYGLDIQKEKIVEYCEKYGVTISEWYVDGGYSGAKLERPEIERLLADAEKGEINTVYVYKLDRMSRDTIDTLTILYKVLPKYDVKIVSMTEVLKFDNPMDKVMVTMNAAMNQYEREVIYMRTRAGMVERVKQGLWMGGGRVPYGYRYDRNDGILHPVEEQAERVREMYHLYVSGYSCDKIARIMGMSSDVIVKNIIARKSNIGLIEYNGVVYKGLHEPIVDKEIFNEAQRQMAKRSTNSYVAADHILTGLCWCGICGARMRYQKWGKYCKMVCYSRYCSNKVYMRRSDNCTNGRLNAEPIEQEIASQFKMFAIDLSETNKKEEHNTFSIENAITKSNTKIKKFYNLYVDNPSDNLMELIRAEEKKVKDLESKLAEEKAESEKKYNEELTEKIQESADVWDVLTDKEKNKVLKLCIDKIILTNDEIEVHWVV